MACEDCDNRYREGVAAGEFNTDGCDDTELDEKFEEGYDEGYTSGFDEGKDEGYAEAKNDMYNALSDL